MSKIGGINCCNIIPQSRDLHQKTHKSSKENDTQMLMGKEKSHTKITSFSFNFRAFIIAGN